MKFFDKKYCLILILLVGIILRFVYLYQYSSSVLFDSPAGPDVEEYYQWAQEIIAGNLLWDEFKIHSPAYPYYLALLLLISSFNFWVLRFLQQFFFLIAGIAMFFYFYRSDCSDEKENKVFLLAMLIWAVYPPFIYLSGELYAETLLISLICLLLIFSRNYLRFENHEKGFFLSALSIGLISAFIVLTHPLSLLFVIFILIFLVVRTFAFCESKTAKIATVFLLFGFLIILAPVSIHNGLRFGVFFPFQANSGFNFYLGNNPNSNGTCYLRPGPDWDTEHEKARYVSETGNISEDKYFLFKSLEFIFKNPLRWLWLLIKKDFLVWNWRELSSGADLFNLRYHTPLQKFTWWSFAFIAVTGLCGILMRFTIDFDRRIGKSETLLLILLFSFWLMQIITLTSARYRSAMIPAIIYFSAYFCRYFIFYLKRSPLKVISFLLISDLVVCAFPSPFDRTAEEAEANSIVAEVLVKKGQLEEAEKILLHTIKVNQRWSRNYNLLGLIYEKKMDLEKALDFYIKAANCNDADKSALTNLALLYGKMGQNEVAENFWQEALSQSPNANTYYNYALKLQNENKFNEAEKFYLKTLSLSPAHSLALNNLGILYINANKPDKALPFLKKAYKLSLNKFNVGCNIVVSLALLGDKTEAKRFLTKIAKLAKTEEDRKKIELIKKEFF